MYIDVDEQAFNLIIYLFLFILYFSYLMALYPNFSLGIMPQVNQGLGPIMWIRVPFPHPCLMHQDQNKMEAKDGAVTSS